jgi:hypothetical protein
MFKPQITATAATPPATGRGILLVALGAAEYGYMAANLAASIRYSDPDVPVHLVYSEQALAHLSPAHLALFSSRAECPAEYYTKGSSPAVRGAQHDSDPSISPPPVTTDYIQAKTYLYDLTPYEETLFLDVDMYILPHVRMGEVIGQLSAVCDYTIKNRGYQNLSGAYTHWFDVEHARKHYKTKGRFYQCQSEFIFFKKNKKNAAFFKKVREVYDTHPIPSDDFRGSVPDEYAYNIAMALTARYPHADSYIPVYWYFLDGRPDWNKVVARDYIGFSLGGDIAPEWLSSKVKAYKNLYRQHLRLPYLFNVPPKRRWNGQKRAA